MVEKKNENWSVNSGKWAYSKDATQQRGAESPSPQRFRWNLAFLAAMAAVAVAALLWLGAFQSLSGMVPSSFWTMFGQRPTVSTETVPQQGSGRSDLEAENARLKDELVEKQRVIDEKQREIDQLQQGAQEVPQLPEEYTVTKRLTTMLNGRSFDLIVDHKFVRGKDHWTQASCYVVPKISGVTYSIDLIRRDQPDYLPKVRLATPDTLIRAGLTWPDIFTLGSSCPWMDGASYSKEELGRIALSEDPEASGSGDQGTLEPLPEPTPEPPVSVRNARQVHRFKDMVGRDIRKLFGISQTECEAFCINDSSCAGYTYDNWNRLCIPKGGIGSLRLEPRSTTVILTDAQPSSSLAPAVMTPRRDRAFPDPAYQSAFAASYEVCSERCMQDSACLGVNFIESSSQCKLFAQPSEYGPRPGVTLGYKSQLE